MKKSKFSIAVTWKKAPKEGPENFGQYAQEKFACVVAYWLAEKRRVLNRAVLHAV